MQINDNTSERMSASLEALNARIARLAIGLGVKLDDQAELAHLMAQPQVVPVAYERRAANPDGHARAPGTSGDRRVAHQREELRGLLVLRYHLGAECVADHGLVLTRQIIETAEEHLVRQGFKPGADGLDLDRIFKST